MQLTILWCSNTAVEPPNRGQSLPGVQQRPLIVLRQSNFLFSSAECFSEFQACIVVARSDEALKSALKVRCAIAQWSRRQIDRGGTDGWTTG